MLLSMRLLGFISLFVSSLLFSQTQLNILAVRVEFQPDQSERTTGDGTFNLSTESARYQVDPPPHNKTYFEAHITAVDDYFSKVSNGDVAITGEVFPLGLNDAYSLPRQMEAYNPNLGEASTNTGLAELFRDAMVLAQADASIDFASYNCVVVFHAGVGKDVNIGVDETPQDIPSLYLSPEFLAQYLDANEVADLPVDRGIIMPETESQVGLQLAMNGIFANNIASFLGLPDLFDPDEGTSVIGQFGIMDAGLFNALGLIPARPMAWTRVYAGWEEAVEILPGSTGTYDISAVQSGTPAVYKMPVSDNESFWLEHRWSGNINRDSLLVELSSGRDTLMTWREYFEEHEPGVLTFDEATGVMVSAENYDYGIRGSGILIWRVDEDIINAKIADNRVNDDEDRRGVSLVEADGANDIGQNYDLLDAADGSQLGYPLDFYFADNGSPFYDNTFNNASFPPALSHYNRAETWIDLKDFSGIAETMQFSVAGDIVLPGYPKQYDAPFKAFSYGKSTSVLVFEDSIKVFYYPQLGPEENEVHGLLRIPVIQDLSFAWHLNDDKGSGFLFWEEDTVYNIYLKDDNFYDFSKLYHPNIIYVAAYASEFFTVVSADSIWQYDGRTLTIVEAEAIDGAVPRLYYADELLDRWPTDFEGIDLSYLNTWEILWDNFDEDENIDGFCFTKDGYLVKRINGNYEAVELPAIPSTQPTSASGDSFRYGQSVTSFFYISDDKLYNIDLNGFILEDYPIKIEGYTRPGSVVISGVSSIDERKYALFSDANKIIYQINLSNPKRQPIKKNIIGELLNIDRNGIFSVFGNQFIKIESGFLSTTNHPFNGIYVAELRENFDVEGQVVINESIFNWPNPNKENHTFIRTRLTKAATIDIRIIDLAGGHIFNTSYQGQPGINDYQWDLSGIASGVYLARVGSGSDYKIIKIMVIK
jgi:M6 family metalloprotease-like protein